MLCSRPPVFMHHTQRVPSEAAMTRSSVSSMQSWRIQR